MEVKCGDVPVGTEGRCPVWRGWLAEVTAADGARSREVQRASSERLGQEEGGQRDSSRLDSAWHMLPWGHLTLPGN